MAEIFYDIRLWYPVETSAGKMKSGLGWERTIKLDLFSKNSLFSEFLIYETSLTINFSCSKEIINQSYVNFESLILRRIIPPIVVFPTHRPLRFPFEKAARETRAHN